MFRDASPTIRQTRCCDRRYRRLCACVCVCVRSGCRDLTVQSASKSVYVTIDFRRKSVSKSECGIRFPEERKLYHECLMNVWHSIFEKNKPCTIQCELRANLCVEFKFEEILKQKTDCVIRFQEKYCKNICVWHSSYKRIVQQCVRA